MSEFLQALFTHIDDDERIEIRAKFRSGRVASRWARSIDECEAIAARIAGAADVWFGPALRLGEHGDAAHTSRLGALWGDVDAKCFEGGKRDAEAAFDAFPLPPSIVVDSGNGYHPYWLLNEALSCAAAGDAARAVMRAIRDRLSERAAARLDPVHDLSRVMRMPGTWNRKRAPALPVMVIHSEVTRRYRLEDFAAAGLSCSSTPVATATWARSERSTWSGVVDAPAWVRRALQYPQACIHHTPSELDFAVVCALVEHVGPAAAESIWLASALGARDKVQLRADYRERTIISAIRATNRTVPEKLPPPSRLHLEVG